MFLVSNASLESVLFDIIPHEILLRNVELGAFQEQSRVFVVDLMRCKLRIDDAKKSYKCLCRYNKVVFLVGQRNKTFSTGKNHDQFAEELMKSIGVTLDIQYAKVPDESFDGRDDLLDYFKKPETLGTVEINYGNPFEISGGRVENIVKSQNGASYFSYKSSDNMDTVHSKTSSRPPEGA